nr:ribonuclease domain-containing protein [Streptomyces sp. DSM 41633]
MGRSRIAALAVLCGLLSGCCAPAPAPVSPGTSPAADGTCDLSGLPPEADTTVELIQSGGPFPYPRNDGVTFGNYEGRLPK